MTLEEEGEIGDAIAEFGVRLLCCVFFVRLIDILHLGLGNFLDGKPVSRESIGNFPSGKSASAFATGNFPGNFIYIKRAQLWRSRYFLQGARIDLFTDIKRTILDFLIF